VALQVHMKVITPCINSIRIRYEKTSEELTRVKTALNEKEMEVEDLVRKLKEANDKVCISNYYLSRFTLSTFL
jgi:predicted  nucleic acid-binding Zn-ribbon protein